MHTETNSLIAVISEDDRKNSPEGSLGTSDLDWASFKYLIWEAKAKRISEMLWEQPKIKDSGVL